MRARGQRVGWIAAAAAVSCVWVSPSEHEANHAGLEALADADADADSDSDSDSDADADSDADTDPIDCVDDGYEPNETVLTATDVVSAAPFDAVWCAGNPDLYAIDVGSLEVVTIDVAGRDTTLCSDLSLTVSIGDDQAQPFPDATAYGCGTRTAGWGAGTYVVAVADLPGADDQAYALTVSIDACVDQDSDGYLSDACGGPDCDDGLAQRYPGAADPQDGFDQDCDGGDDLATNDCVVSSGFAFVDGTVACGVLDRDPVWDLWEVPVTAGAELSVVAQNDVLGSADLLAVIVDPDQTSHYGLEDDLSQMDDEGACNAVPWNGGRCPAACVYPTRDGVARIWVAQRPGAGCVDGAYYQLLVYLDGNAPAPAPVQVQDDTALALSFP